MRQALRLLRLDPRRRAALIRAAAWIVSVRLLLPWVALPRLQRWTEPAPGAPGFVALPEELAWAVAAAARRLPGTTCLPRALALHALLRRAGHASRIEIGVRPAPHAGIAAHAWVTCAGRVVGDAPPDEYAVLGPLRT